MTRTALSLLLLALSACEPEAGLVVGKVGDSIMANMGEELDFESQSRSHGHAMTTLAALPCTALGRDNAYFTRRIYAFATLRIRAIDPASVPPVAPDSAREERGE